MNSVRWLGNYLHNTIKEDITLVRGRKKPCLAIDVFAEFKQMIYTFVSRIHINTDWPSRNVNSAAVGNNFFSLSWYKTSYREFMTILRPNPQLRLFFNLRVFMLGHSWGQQRFLIPAYTRLSFHSGMVCGNVFLHIMVNLELGRGNKRYLLEFLNCIWKTALLPMKQALRNSVSSPEWIPKKELVVWKGIVYPPWRGDKHLVWIEQDFLRSSLLFWPLRTTYNMSLRT